MLISILGALLAGCLVSWIVPFVPFAAALTAAVAIGAIWAGVQGHSLAVVALDAIALLFATQVGYALGLVLHAVVGPKAPSVEPSPTAAAERREIRDLRFGKES